MAALVHFDSTYGFVLLSCIVIFEMMTKWFSDLSGSCVKVENYYRHLSVSVTYGVSQGSAVGPL